MLTTFIYPLPPHLSQLFLDHYIFPPTPTASPSASIRSYNTYIYTRSPSTQPVQSVSHLAVAHALHLTASAACICSPIRMLEYAAVYCFCLPPFFFPRSAPRSLSASGGFTCCEALRLRVSPLLPPYVFPRVLAYSGVWFLSGGFFFVRGREVRAPTLPGS